jgi:hypothetical protein
MKYKAIRSFLHNGAVVEEGAVIELPDREAGALLRFKRIEVHTEVEEKAPVDVPLADLTKDALLARCAALGIEAKPTMKKGELIALLEAME